MVGVGRDEFFFFWGVSGASYFRFPSGGWNQKNFVLWFVTFLCAKCSTRSEDCLSRNGLISVGTYKNVCFQILWQFILENDESVLSGILFFYKKKKKNRGTLKNRVFRHCSISSIGLKQLENVCSGQDVDDNLNK